jgi:hypothetical protein
VDTLARVYALGMAEILGTNVVIDTVQAADPLKDFIGLGGTTSALPRQPARLYSRLEGLALAKCGVTA